MTCAMPATVTDSGVGNAVVGHLVRDIARTCRVLSDTMRPWREGPEVRVLEISLGRDTASVMVENDRVSLVGIFPPSTLRTSDSLGLGSTLDRLLQLHGATGTFYEGRLFVRSPRHCGITFAVQPDGLDVDSIRPEWTEAQLRTLSPTAPVVELLVGGCRSSLGAPSG